MPRTDNPRFEVDHRKLAADPLTAGFARAMSGFSPIDSRAAFNRYCVNACHLWSENYPGGRGKTSALFAALLERIGAGGEGAIPTSWGGVVITRHEHPRVEKYLVVRKGGYLALEKHARKIEHLESREGAGLVLWRERPLHPLTVETALPGKLFDFTPGVEHCVIGTEDLLILESSTDPKGMDQDLIFIYSPE